MTPPQKPIDPKLLRAIERALGKIPPQTSGTKASRRRAFTRADIALTKQQLRGLREDE